MKSRFTIGFDGDDTLWHCENLYAMTQEKFTKLLSPYSGGKDIAEFLLTKERENLEIFGYGIKGFVLSMIETAIELSNGKISAADIEKIINAGKQMMNHPLEILEDVRIALELLANAYDLILITKGELFDQESKISQSNLSELFKAIEIVSEKNTETYRRILKSHQIPVAKFIMVGNSLRSDIAPVIDLGGQAILIPYHVTWKHEAIPIYNNNPMKGQCKTKSFWQLKSINDLPRLINQITQHNH